MESQDGMRLSRREVLVGAGALGAAIALPGVADAGARAASPHSPLAERIAKNERTTVDTRKGKKDPPYTIALVNQGPFNGWGKLYNVASAYAIQQSGKFKKTLSFDSFGDPAK